MYAVGSAGYYNDHLLANGGTYLAQPVPPFTWNLAQMRRAPLLEPKVIVARKAADRLSLTSSAWDAVPCEELGPRSLGSPAPQWSSHVKVAYDAAALYIRFEGRLPEDWTPPPARSDDNRLLDEESFGVVLAPDNNPARYFRFAGGPDGAARYDARHGFIEDPIDPRFDRDDVSWNAEWHYACTVADDATCWSALFAIPFTSLGTGDPAAGTEWKVNFDRVHRARPSMPREQSLWSSNPGTTSIGDRKAFGTLRFQ